MLQSWRWYGQHDPVSLEDIEQAGAEKIVTALHHIPNGEVWTVAEIEKRKNEIAFDAETGRKRNLEWTVVESVPVHDDIKTQQGNYEQLIENYIQSLENLGKCGIKTVCYNFMPMLDWTRTDLEFVVKDLSKALRFNWVDFAAFDLYMLEREGAAEEYDEELKQEAKKAFEGYSEAEKVALEKTLILGLPGSEESFTREYLKKGFARYDAIDDAKSKQHLYYFLQKIMPTAEKYGISMVIHPDDPPFSVFGLPRVMSTYQDLADLFENVPSKSNGFTLCTGSFGARLDNDVPKMIRDFGERMKFIHLRNVQSENKWAFHEANHLEGNVDMYEVVKEIVTVEKQTGEQIPMRPDHGHQMLDDLNKKTFPGYSAIGRLRGLAELRGLELGVTRNLK